MAADAEHLTNIINGKLKLPTEVWKDIFDLVEGPQPKLFKRLRQVCKFWRDVVDNHFYFEPNVNDGSLDLNYLSHLRVKQCHVTRLLSPRSAQIRFFRDPKLVTKLSISGKCGLNGPISRSNFWNLIAQIPNVDDLTLHVICFNQPGLLQPKTPEEEANYNRLVGHLTTLEVNGMFMMAGPGTDDDNPVVPNFLQITASEFPKLKTLKLCIPTYLCDEVSGLIPFLAERTPELTSLQIMHAAMHRVRASKVKLAIINENQFHLVHLRKLVLIIHTKEWKNKWMPIVNLQKSLEHLQIKIRRVDLTGISSQDFLQLADLEEAFTLNGTTLQSLELENFVVPFPINAATVFGELVKLNTLVLCREKMDVFSRSSKIFNIARLPQSIENVTFDCLDCDRNDVDEASKSLKNLKYFQTE